MFFAKRRQAETLPVGVHVGADALRLIQLRVERGLAGPAHSAGPAGVTRPTFPNSLSIVASHKVPACDVPPAAAAALVRIGLRGGRFVGRDVVTALPPAMTHVKTFRLGPLPPAETQAALRRHALDGTPFGPSEPVHVDVLPVGEVRQGRDARQEYVAVAARDADVRAILTSAGGRLIVRSLQAEPYAVYRAVAGPAVCADADATHAVVHVGEAETLVLVGVGPHLRVVRRVAAGAGHLDRAVARKLGVSPPEARRLRRRTHGTPSPDAGGADPVRAVVTDAVRPMMEEVAREAALCVRYHSVSFRAAPPRSIRLLGADAAGGQLRALLAAATGFPIDTRGVLEGLGPVPLDNDGGWAVALGLALTYAPAATNEIEASAAVAGSHETGAPNAGAAEAAAEVACA